LILIQFWVFETCGSGLCYRLFGGTCCLHPLSNKAYYHTMPRPRNKITITETLFRVDGITHTTEVINNKTRNQSLSLGHMMNGNIFAIL